MVVRHRNGISARWCTDNLRYNLVHGGKLVKVNSFVPHNLSSHRTTQAERVRATTGKKSGQTLAGTNIKVDPKAAKEKVPLRS